MQPYIPFRPGRNAMLALNLAQACAGLNGAVLVPCTLKMTAIVEVLGVVYGTEFGRQRALTPYQTADFLGHGPIWTHAFFVFL